LKFCQPHWNKLRTAIDARGLSGLVAQGGENAVARQFDQLQRSQNAEEAVTKTNFDPLMGAHWAIVNNAMNLVGLSLMLPNEDGSDGVRSASSKASTTPTARKMGVHTSTTRGSSSPRATCSKRLRGSA